MTLFGLQTGNVLENWVSVGAVLTGSVTLLGAALTFFRFMRLQEGKIDAIGNDLKASQMALHADLAALRAEMNHRFERLSDQNAAFVREREFGAWVDKLRDGNKTMAIPSYFQRD